MSEIAKTELIRSRIDTLLLELDIATEDLAKAEREEGLEGTLSLKILDYLDLHCNLQFTAIEISKALSANPHIVRATLSKLTTQGDLVRPARGLYRIKSIHDVFIPVTSFSEGYDGPPLGDRFYTDKDKALDSIRRNLEWVSTPQRFVVPKVFSLVG